METKGESNDNQPEKKIECPNYGGFFNDPSNLDKLAEKIGVEYVNEQKVGQFE
jgi:hypothetical protein